MIDQQQQRDHQDEQHTRAELEAEGRAELEAETAAAVAATIGTFAMHQHRAFFAGEPFDPPALLAGVGGFLRNVTFAGEMFGETGGRIPFSDLVLSEQQYVDPAELPDWTRDCPWTVVQSMQFTDEVPF